MQVAFSRRIEVRSTRKWALSWSRDKLRKAQTHAHTTWRESDGERLSPFTAKPTLTTQPRSRSFPASPVPSPPLSIHTHTQTLTHTNTFTATISHTVHAYTLVAGTTHAHVHHDAISTNTHIRTHSEIHTPRPTHVHTLTRMLLTYPHLTHTFKSFVFVVVKPTSSV